jgi:hypothetical protein
VSLRSLRLRVKEARGLILRGDTKRAETQRKSKLSDQLLIQSPSVIYCPNMLLTLLFLSGSALLGLGIVHRCLAQLLNRVEKLLWGVVLGWSISTAAVYVIARWQLKLSIGIIIWVTVFTFLAAVPLLAQPIRRLNKNQFKWQPHVTGVLVLVCLFTPIYWGLFSSHFFAPGPSGVYSGGSAYADLSFHAAVSTSFLYGDNFPPAYSPSAGKPLLYPFLPDFQTAVLMTTGISLRAALMITSLMLAIVTTALVFYFAIRITVKPLVGILATILFLLNGGLGVIDLVHDWRSSGQSFGQFWSNLQVNYANYSDHALHWPNIITDGFVPQRTILFGLPLGLMVLTLFASEWKRTDTHGNHWKNAEVYLFAGLTTGLLPLFHVHTFLVLGLVSGFLFLLKPDRRWLLYWSVSVLVASPSIFSLTTQASSGEFLRLQPGWMGQSAAFFPWYLLRNLGLPLLLAVPAWLLLEHNWRKFYLAFVLVLVFALNVVISPNLFDNGKLIYYWHAVNSVVVANLLVQIAFAYRQSLVATALMLACIATGITALQSERLQSTLLFDKEEIAAATFVTQQTSPQSLFLTAPITKQPILCLAGRKILRGPTSWLWSHGYEFRDREADVRRIYAGTSDAKELLNYYNVDYVFVGIAEREHLHAQQSFFDANFPVLFKSSSITIYDSRNAHKAASHQSVANRLEYDPYVLFLDFPNTSFFAYRTLKLSNGHIPNFNEFSEAMRLLTHDVSFDSVGWKEQLEANRSQLINDVATRFGGLSDADYVNSLMKKAGDSTAIDETNKFSTSLARGTETRATVLRKIVDDAHFYNREYNTAFVLMHYFGYLRRNPGDPPDLGLEGLNYWRDILDKSKDYRSISRAFLESEEYKRREIR